MGHGGQDERLKPTGSGIDLLFSRRRRQLAGGNAAGRRPRGSFEIRVDTQLLHLYRLGELPQIDGLLDPRLATPGALIGRSAKFDTDVPGEFAQGFVVIDGEGPDGTEDPMFFAYLYRLDEQGFEIWMDDVYKGEDLELACRRLNTEIRRERARNVVPGGGDKELRAELILERFTKAIERSRR